MRMPILSGDGRGQTGTQIEISCPLAARRLSEQPKARDMKLTMVGTVYSTWYDEE